MTRARVVVAVAVVTAATLVFAFWQQTPGVRGGSIGPAKVAWLNLTLLAFLVVPALAWRDRRLPAPLRALFGLLAASFAVRGLVEVPLLYATQLWHCDYGVAHDLATAAVVAGLWLRRRHALRQAPATARALLGLSLVLAAVEAGFARAFCAVADPAEIWFANAEARFAMINAATWVVVAIAYPLLGAVLVRHTAPALPMKEPLGAHRLTPRRARRIPGDRGDRPHAHPAREGAGQRPAP